MGDAVLDMIGAPIWLLAIPPIVASVSVVAYMTSPRRRRDPSLRGVLIASVALTAVEAIVLALVFGFLLLWAASGGMETF